MRSLPLLLLLAASASAQPRPLDIGTPLLGFAGNLDIRDAELRETLAFAHDLGARCVRITINGPVAYYPGPTLLARVDSALTLAYRMGLRVVFQLNADNQEEDAYTAATGTRMGQAYYPVLRPFVRAGTVVLVELDNEVNFAALSTHNKDGPDAARARMAQRAALLAAFSAEMPGMPVSFGGLASSEIRQGGVGSRYVLEAFAPLAQSGVIVNVIGVHSTGPLEGPIASLATAAGWPPGYVVTSTESKISGGGTEAADAIRRMLAGGVKIILGFPIGIGRAGMEDHLIAPGTPDYEAWVNALRGEYADTVTPTRDGHPSDDAPPPEPCFDEVCTVIPHAAVYDSTWVPPVTERRCTRYWFGSRWFGCRTWTDYEVTPGRWNVVVVSEAWDEEVCERVEVPCE
jgi:hypothetical protein